MRTFLYYSMLIVILENNNICCYDIRDKVNLSAIPNIETLMHPIKKLSGVFPNHEIQVQFDVETMKRKHKEPKRNYNPKHPVLKSRKQLNNVTYSTEEVSTTGKKTRQLVYMDDLKEVFERLEKKLESKLSCNLQESKIAATEVPNKQVVDILDFLKKNFELQKGTDKPNDNDISWLKIQVPA